MERACLEISENLTLDQRTKHARLLNLGTLCTRTLLGFAGFKQKNTFPESNAQFWWISLWEHLKIQSKQIKVNKSKIVDIPIKHPFMMMDMLIFSQDVVMLRSRRFPGNQQSLWASKPKVDPVVAPHTPGTFEGSQRINIEITKINLPPSNVAVMYIMTWNNPVKNVFIYTLDYGFLPTCKHRWSQETTMVQK